MTKSELEIQIALGTYDAYRHWQSNGDRESLLSEFAIEETELEGCTILFAIYVAENYEGTAWALFEKDGKFYEVNGSHCSCMGLETQWKPEEANVKELLHRVNEGTFSNFYDADDVLNAQVKSQLLTLLTYLENSRG